MAEVAALLWREISAKPGGWGEPQGHDFSGYKDNDIEVVHSASE